MNSSDEETADWDEAAAEWTTVAAVADIGLPVWVTEVIGTRTTGRTWVAKTSIRTVMYDGLWPAELPVDDPDHGATEVAGVGDSRTAALADLARSLRRVTHGLVVCGGGTTATPRHVINVAWDGRRIARVPSIPTPDRVR